MNDPSDPASLERRQRRRRTSASPRSSSVASPSLPRERDGGRRSGTAGSIRSLGAVISLFVAAGAAVMFTGGREQGSLGIFLLAAGLILIVFPPRQRLRLSILGPALLFVGCGALALLPHDLFPKPQWRLNLEAAPAIPLKGTISVSPADTVFWLALLAISVGIAFWILTQAVRTRHLLWVALIAASGVSAYAALSIDSAMFGWEYPYDIEKTFGFFPNRNHTASLLVTGAILSLGILGLPRGLGHVAAKILAASILLICLVGLLFFSVSRAGVVFGAVGAVLWVVGCGRQYWANWRVLALGIAAILAVLVFFSIATAAQRRVLTLAGLEESRRPQPVQSQPGLLGRPQIESDVLWDFRILIFADAFRMVRDYPLTGAGLGTFPLVSAQYRDLTLLNASMAHPESDWLMLMAEGGIPMFLLALGIVVVLLRGLFRERDHPYWLVRWGIASAALTALLHGVLDVPAHRIPLGWWILLLGCVAAQPRPVGGEGRRWVVQWLVSIVAGAGAVIMGSALVRAQWFGGEPLPPFAPEIAQERMYALFEKGRLEEAVELADAAIEKSPAADGLYEQLGTLLLNFEGTEDEVDTIFQAQGLLQPHWPGAQIQQGRAWLTLDPERSARLWREAVRRQQEIDRRGRHERAAGQYRQLIQELPPWARGEMLDPALGTTFLIENLEKLPWKLGGELLRQLSKQREFVASLSAEQQARFIAAWLSRDELAELVGFADSHPEWEDAFWPVRIRVLVQQKEWEQAVRLATARFGVSLDLPDRDANAQPRGEGAAARFVQWWQLGNDVAARWSLRQGKPDDFDAPEVARLRAAVAADDGDWPLAWKELNVFLRLQGNPLP